MIRVASRHVLELRTQNVEQITAADVTLNFIILEQTEEYLNINVSKKVQCSRYFIV